MSAVLMLPVQAAVCWCFFYGAWRTGVLIRARVWQRGGDHK